MCDVGEYEMGLGHLRRAVDKGYYVAPTLSSSHAFDAVRNNPAFQARARRCGSGPPTRAGRFQGSRRRSSSRSVRERRQSTIARLG